MSEYGPSPQEAAMLQLPDRLSPVIRMQFERRVADKLGLSLEERFALGRIPLPHWITWSMAVFGEREKTSLVMLAPNEVEQSDSLALRLMGEIKEGNGQFDLDHREGELAKRTRALYEGYGYRGKTMVAELSQSCADFVFALGATIGFDSPAWHRVMPRHPQTNILLNNDGTRAVKFSSLDESFDLEGRLESIVNLGPGMTGAEFAMGLLGAKDIYFVSAGMGADFIHRWIGEKMSAINKGMAWHAQRGALAGLLAPGLDLADATLPTPHFYKDGMGKTMEILKKKHQKNQWTTDVVMMSAVHSAGPEECTAGIEGAAAILRPGGYLVIKAPTTSLDGSEAGMDVMEQIAAEMFGSATHSGACGEHAQGKVLERRPASYAIYQKQ